MWRGCEQMTEGWGDLDGLRANDRGVWIFGEAESKLQRGVEIKQGKDREGDENEKCLMCIETMLPDPGHTGTGE